MKVSEYIIEFLFNVGAEHVFTVPGGFSMHMNDSLNYSKLTAVPCLHESGAGFAANGYSAAGGLGVCLVTSGPGITNALTPLVSAWQDSLPVIYISGEANVENIEKRKQYQLRQGGVQDVSINFVKKFTQYSVTICKPSMVEMMLNNAMAFMTSGRRGPVWIAVPLDVQGAEL